MLTRWPYTPDAMSTTTSPPSGATAIAVSQRIASDSSISTPRRAAASTMVLSCSSAVDPVVIVASCDCWSMAANSRAWIRASSSAWWGSVPDWPNRAAIRSRPVALHGSPVRPAKNDFMSSGAWPNGLWPR